MKDKKTIWIGTIEGIFGYGMIVIGNSETQVMESLRKEYDDWKKSRKESTSKKIFLEAFENWGGLVDEVEIGKVYFDNFKN